MDPIILYVERRDRREIYGRSIEYDEFLFFNHWPVQEPKFDWRYRFHLFLAKKFQAYFLGNIPAIHMAKHIRRVYVPPSVGSWIPLITLQTGAAREIGWSTKLLWRTQRRHAESDNGRRSKNGDQNTIDIHRSLGMFGLVGNSKYTHPTLEYPILIQSASASVCFKYVLDILNRYAHQNVCW